MDRGYLKNYFIGIGVKTLSEVDANPKKSNQHEVGIKKPMRNFLLEQARKFASSFIWLGDENESIVEYGEATYYDARANNPNRSAEWRLYYPSNSVTEIMNAGDSLFLALRPDDTLLFIVVPQDSTLESQLLWLFNVSEQERFEFIAREFHSDTGDELDFVAKYLLDEIGIQFEDPNANSLDNIIERFGLQFPKTADFSTLARATLPEVDALNYPDLALIAWLNHEEAMFRRLEKKIVSNRIEKGFMDEDGADVDAFIKFSLSVQNRRKSRMGYSFENHLSALFDIHDIRYSSQVKTEKGKKPDFIFPSSESYFDTSFDASNLTMLAAKSSCKDRWSQVLPEAERVPQKHLVTLEPAIAEPTTDSMKASFLQLVVPDEIRQTYKVNQQKWIWNIDEFLELVKTRQHRYSE